MTIRALTFALLVAVAAAESTSHVRINLGNGGNIEYSNGHGASSYPTTSYHPTSAPSYHSKPAPSYHPKPSYKPAPSYQHEPSYKPAPSYQHEPSYKPAPSYQHEPSYKPEPSYYQEPSYNPAPSYHPAPSYRPAPSYHHEPEVPACAEMTNSTWCLEDEEYPEYELKHAIEYHLDKFNSLYADVAELDTALSVERPNTLEEETYLCPSETAYIRPLRAQNTEGMWRVIVNELKIHYKTFTQTARIEECLTAGDECPKVPMCYETTCLQKSVYHRFLVYDPYDQYFPFAVESFKLPASCACLLGTYFLDH